MTDAFLSALGIVRLFGAVRAVDGADLEVEQGSLTALLGPSGCGKTTLLRLIGGLDAPTAGTIALAGTVLSGPRAFVPPERRRVGLVFQDFALFPHMDIGANIAFGLPKGVDRKPRVAQLLEMVHLPGLERRMPHELSGGQQQRVALARALAAEPRLILLDEPFSNLDPSIRAAVRLEVQQLIKAIGITAVFVTHDQDEALSLADRVAVMIAGRVLQASSPRDLYERPNSRAVAEFIGNPNFLAGEVVDGTARCELGCFPVAVDFSGRADILVRSEDVAPSDSGVGASVLSCEYYGHEQRVELRLASGALVRSRWRAERVLEPGDSVQVRVTGAVNAFPAS